VAELTPAEVDDKTDALLAEAEAYFMGDGGLHNAATAIAERLAKAGIDYAIAGGIALGEHGFKRLTVDVDVLIRREDLARFKAEWLERGYVDVRPGGRARPAGADHRQNWTSVTLPRVNTTVIPG
jgi:hypothetical protein